MFKKLFCDPTRSALSLAILIYCLLGSYGANQIVAQESEAIAKPAEPKSNTIESEEKEDEESSKARASFKTRYRPHWFGLRMSLMGGFQSNGTLNQKINNLTTTTAAEKEAVSQKRTSTWTAGADGGIEHFLVYIPGGTSFGIEGGFQMRLTEKAQAGVGDNSNIKVSQDYFYEDFQSTYIYGGLIWNLTRNEKFGWNLSAGAGPITNEFTIKTRKRTASGDSTNITYDFKGEGLGFYLKNSWEWRLASFVSVIVSLQYTLVPSLEYVATRSGKNYSLGTEKIAVGNSTATVVAPKEGTSKSSDIDFSNGTLHIGMNFWYW